MKLLLVEDEAMLAEATAQILKKQGYMVDIAAEGEYGLDCLLSGVYDLAILDIMLPKKDGLAILKEAREAGIEIPILMLTAKGELDDRVAGLNSGADDYLSKPFQYQELLARLKALGRRKGAFKIDGILSFGDFELNPYNLSLKTQTEELGLTKKEANILEMLVANYPQLSSKDRIIEKVWGYDSEAEYNHVEMHVSLLRKKLRQVESVTQIKVVRNLGYRLEFTSGEGDD
ncbi:response regulator transcription factor [Enterococcus hulanensis]|uniref:Response regulator transcription factor n=1 Tax=Enterococcus hulanensis TaxID=2559929 RepID=A0ABU3EUU1_9ENTE|nr:MULTISPECIES: response regulator transcription factor [Enterococcus]MBO0455680.1 response regulator transcription factor [Enterococcus hulanensis]MBX8935395.1 response regulator transcription factor [Enterococcus gilvus]MDT2598619.1 response regulator transcription factor [Enterococcus hulanensis]MDT2607876.1 response regulator transcription factor [Enterococcus hulanensis]MDT2615171.1 response regulator transcription factor [Enterococcus hulanensis]